MQFHHYSITIWYTIFRKKLCGLPLKSAVVLDQKYGTLVANYYECGERNTAKF